MGLMPEHVPHMRPFGLGGENVTIAAACPQENGNQIDLFSSGDPTALPG